MKLRITQLHAVLGLTSAAVAFFVFPSCRLAAWQLQEAPLLTPWAHLVDTNMPLPEYPRPQMMRAEWLNLNGIWQFQPGTVSDPVPTNTTLSEEILVPFPMESALSGVAEHHPRSWYRRMFTVPPGWSGQRILLHLDAVDWESEVFINGQSVGIHKGGYDQITYDITDRLTGNGPQELIVRVYDPTGNYGQPRGKQTLTPAGIMYTSTSGIWQTVWLEPVPATSVASHKLIPVTDSNRLNVTVQARGPTNGVTVHAVARIGTNVIGTVSGAPGTELHLPVPNANLWSPTNPFLYDLDLVLSNGPVRLDAVTSYFGMRKVSLGTTNGFVKMLLNNQFVFQFGPLDQGFWPDGIYTAPTDDALKSDIEQTKLFGYNMIRKHIKVEPARWYYWADKLGMLVWQDMPSANSYDPPNPVPPVDEPQFQVELVRMVETHWSHPSIISWVMFNESQGQQNTASLVATVKAMDPSRFVNQASGGTHFGVGDILDVHSYPNPSCPSSASQAVVCGEFGGLGLSVTNHIWAPGWGYGGLLSDSDELATRFEDMCLQLANFVQNQGLSAAVYTEITDVEIELNGFLTYDREVRKPDPDRIRAAIALASSSISTTTVVPTSEVTGQNWRYRFTQPSSAWVTTNYDDSTANWTTGAGGFGSGQPPQTAPYTRTAWTSSDIWLRRSFNPGNLTSQQISNLHFNVFNDEDVEIYINGVLAGSATGYRTSYGLMPVNAAGKSALVLNASNVLAVHCHQTGGGQYIDVGISVLETSVSVPPRPVPSTPTGLQGAAGGSSIALGWDSSTHATIYNIKRGTASGGPYTDLLLTSPLNSVTDGSVSDGVTYYYVVSAENAAGESGDSTEVAVTAVVPAPPPPAVVTWFKADALSGLTNGQPVSAWPDVSGSGHDATQANASRRPSFATGVINGLPAVRFNSTNSTFLAFDRPVEDDFTIFCVFRSSQGIGTGTHFYQGAGLINGEVANVVNDYGMSLNANGAVLAGTGNPDRTIASATGFNDGQPHLVVFKRTRSTGGLELHVDGVFQGAQTGGQQLLTSPSRLVLGAQQTEILFLSGDIAEVKVYDAALSASDRVAEENALNCKYGLGAGAPPATPAGLEAAPGNRQAVLHWNPSMGATGYKLNWSLSSGGPFTQVVGNLATTSYVHTSAAVGETNYYVVASYSSCGTSAFSPVVGVYLPLPVLDIAADSGSFTLSWPEWADDWILRSTTNLAPPILWAAVTNPVFVSNGFLTTTLPLQDGNEFFQLSSP